MMYGQRQNSRSVPIVPGGGAGFRDDDHDDDTESRVPGYSQCSGPRHRETGHG